MGRESRVRSKNGVEIGYETFGGGAPPMVLVHGGTADRTRWLPVVDQLSRSYTVYAMDRRGRGLSGDDESQPYSLAREAEDVAAVVDTVGPDVYLVAHSYGAICALEAALLTENIGRMVLYEPPIPTPGHAVVPRGAQARLHQAAAVGDPESILRVFFREIIELPEAAIDAMAETPMWAARLEAAPTIVREGDAVEAYEVSDRLAGIAVPVRLLLGTESPHYYRPAAEAVAAVIKGAELVPLNGQAHLAITDDPDQFVAAVLGFGCSA